MTEDVPSKDERDFAFTEYKELLALLKQSNAMIWTGYGAFFGVNSLLLTTFGLIVTSEIAAKIPVASKLLVALIGLTGMFLCLVAVLVILSISRNQRKLIERGIELEGITKSALVSILDDASRKTPWPTIVGAALFAGLWLAALAFAFSYLGIKHDHP